jgi:hypothetical protein
MNDTQRRTYISELLGRSVWLNEHEISLFVSGQYIECIKDYKIRNNFSLRESADVINYLRENPDYLQTRMELKNLEFQELLDSINGLDDEEKFFFNRKEYIQCIKNIRMRADLSLRDAKRIVDYYREFPELVNRGRFTKEINKILEI